MPITDSAPHTKCAILDVYKYIYSKLYINAITYINIIYILYIEMLFI